MIFYFIIILFLSIPLILYESLKTKVKNLSVNFVYMRLNNLALNGEVEETTIDDKFICSLIHFIENDLIFFKKVRLDSVSARRVLTGYYDILRMTIEAIGLKQGYKIRSQNMLVCLLLELDEREFSQKFNSFKQLRNGLIHGERNVSVTEVRIIKDEIISLILKLKRKYL